MALALTINGTDRIANLKWGSLRIRQVRAFGSQWTADFTLFNLTPVADQTVVITDKATTYFDGYARTITAREYKPGNWITQVSCQQEQTDITFPLTSPVGLSDQGADGYFHAITDLAPVSYWRLGESSGTTADDAMDANDGTYVDTPTLGVAGALTTDANTGITVNGSSEYVSLGGPILAGETDFTIIAWGKTTSITDTVGVLYQESGGDAVIRLGVVSATGFLQFLYKDNVATTDDIQDDADWTDGAWHMFAVTKDGTAVTLFVDGAEKLLDTLTAGDTLTEVTASYIGGSAAVDRQWEGSLDEVAVFDKALSVATIANLYSLKASYVYGKLEVTQVSARGTSYTATETTGKVTTLHAGIPLGAKFAVVSDDLGLTAATATTVQEIELRWLNAATIEYTIYFGDAPVHLVGM